MYISKLESWKDTDWERFFSQSAIVIPYHKIIVKDIFTRDSKRDIEKGFDELTSIGVLNGVGPSWFLSWIRDLLSWFFPFIRWEWHDINFLIGGTVRDFNKANWGLLKYSIVSSAKRGFPDFIFIPFSFPIIILFYLLCQSFGILFFRWDGSMLDNI